MNVTTSVITPETIAESFGEPGVVGFDGICTCCGERSDHCTCDAEPYYALAQMHRRAKVARAEFEQLVMAQRAAGVPHRQIAWQAGLAVNAIQAIERKHR